MWVNTLNASQAIFSSVIAVNDIAGDSESFQIMASGGSPGDWVVYNNVSYSFGEIQATKWTHLAVTFENDTLRQYLDADLVTTTVVPNGTIDSIEIYKLAVNRAGNTFFEGLIDEVQIWNRTLSAADIVAVNSKAAWNCPVYSGAGYAETHIEQDFDFDDELMGHAWILYGYAMKDGWVNGDYHLEIDAFAANGSLLSSNSSSTNSLATSWNSRTVRFRPHPDATSFKVRMVAAFENVSRNGSIYFDTMNLRAIRPHFSWVDGSIAETAVSTGGRTFAWGAGYGQSLVADLLEDGVSGVKGYVYEPYLSAVGYPSVLLPYYAYGYNLAEVNYAANPMISWMGTVVGDPKMAPFSDILHDVNLTAIRANGTVSHGAASQLEVVIQNDAPGPAKGFLTVTDRQNSLLLANITIQLPGGDQPGSRQILSLNITPVRSGFTEFVVQYVATDWLNPERVTVNNLIALNIQVNAAPTVEDIDCPSKNPQRGDSVGCRFRIQDDLGVTTGRFGVRPAGTDGAWNWFGAGSSDGIDWWVTFVVDIEWELGFVDVRAEVTDAGGLVSWLDMDAVFSIRDAESNWYGIHVDAADDPLWNGMTALPNTPPEGITRGQLHTLTACVKDADHDAQNEKPRFIVNRGELAPLRDPVSPATHLFCYEADWNLATGSALTPVDITLNDHTGNPINTRRINVQDQLPAVNIELQDLSGTAVPFAWGQNDAIWVTVDDVDDDLVIYQGELRVVYPGSGVQIRPFTVPADQAGVLLELDQAAAGLERGDLEVSVSIVGANAATNSTSSNWPIRMLAPQIQTPTFCLLAPGPLRFSRGTEMVAWTWTTEHRPLSSVSITLTQSGWRVPAKPLPAETSPPTGCAPIEVDANWTAYGFIVEMDAAMVAGAASLIATARDIDGLLDNEQLALELYYPAPEINLNAIPSAVLRGDVQLLSIGVLDADGGESTDCIIDITNFLNLSIHRQSISPDMNGSIETWFHVPRHGGPFQLNVTCTDADAQIGSAQAGPIELLNNTNATPGSGDDSTLEGGLGSDSGPALTTILAVAGALILTLLLVGVVTIFISRRRREQNPWGEEEEQQQQQAWDSELDQDAGASPLGEQSAPTNLLATLVEASDAQPTPDVTSHQPQGADSAMNTETAEAEQPTNPSVTAIVPSTHQPATAEIAATPPAQPTPLTDEETSTELDLDLDL
jgi:hypothetical protein